MPSWKKVILSGSDAALNSLNVSTSITSSIVSASRITGSLFGTSSWAIRAVSSSYFSGSNIIVNDLTVNNNLNWAKTPNQVAWFTPPYGYIVGAGAVNIYTDENIDPRPYSLRVGEIDPNFYQSSGSHILKDGRELFTNAKISEDEEPFIILGFGGKNAIQLDTGIDYTHPGIDDYNVLLDPGSVVAGSLKLRKSLYGLQDDKGVQLFADGFAVRPQSPGFLIGQGGYYIFESASMQFNISGGLVSPVESASVKFTLGSDSSSLSLLVGKNDLREALFISRSGNEPRVGIGLTTPQNTLTVSGSLRVFTSITSSIVSASQIRSSTLTSSFANISQISATGITTSNLITSEISASNTVRLSGGILELPNLSAGAISDYAKLLIVDSVGRVRTLGTGSVPYIGVGSGVVPAEQKLVMFTGSTGDVANAIGTSYSSTTGWNFASAGTSYDITTGNLFAANILNVNLTSSIISASGGITGSNLSINGFPNVSASLASLASGVGTLQQVTDAGNTTNKAISSSFNGVGFFGTASWAINVVNGGGGGGGGSDSAFLNQSTAATTWSFAHNLGTQYPVITVYDTTGLVIIPQEIDGEDTNNLKIYFPTSQSGYATAVGGTSALTYYSQSLTTASVNLNTITFTKGDSSTFEITVNTGSGGGGTSDFPYTGSAIISGSLLVTGSTYITGGFEALGSKGSSIQLGTYNVGYDVASLPTFYITGSGLIISGNMPDQNHHNFLKIGNVELVDVNTSFSQNDFLIHNVNTLRITSGADGGNITNSGQLLKIGGGEFYVYRAGSLNSAGIIRSAGATTTIEDTTLNLISNNLSFNSNNLYLNIPDGNEISTLNGTDYLIGFATNPTPSAQLAQKIKANKFIWVTGSNQIISGGLIITGSTNSSGGFTGSLFGTSSWAINAQTASYILNAVSSSFALTSSLANRNILTASVSSNTITFTKGDGTTFPITVNTGSGGGGSVGTLQQVTEQGASTTVPITASIISASSFTGSLFGTASWALNVVGGGGGGVGTLAQVTALGASTTVPITASIISASSFTGSLFGTASWAISSSRATTASFALTSSFVNNLNQNLAITGAVILSGSALPELRVIGDSQFTGSVILNGSVSIIGTTSMTGSLVVSTNITASRTFLSSSNGTVNGSTLTVYGSGSAQPVFTVQGSSGELFSVTDSLTGSLFSVNDISGLPILEVFSDNSVLIGSYLDPMLISTAKVTQTNSGSFTVYSLPTSSYDTAFFEYSVKSGSNARAGTIMAIQSGTSVNFTETTTTDFGSTSAISFTVIITGSNMALTGSSTAGSWTIKTIVRGI